MENNQTQDEKPKPALRDLIAKVEHQLTLVFHSLYADSDRSRRLVAIAMEKIENTLKDCPDADFLPKSFAIIHQLVREENDTNSIIPIELLRSSYTVLAKADLFPGIIEEAYQQLPSLDRDLLRKHFQDKRSIATIADGESRLAASIEHDITNLLLQFVAILSEINRHSTDALPRFDEIGRLSFRFYEENSSEDERLVLRSLLMGDENAKEYFLLFAAVFREVQWKFQGMPKPIELAAPIPPTPTRGVTSKEWIVTGIFIAISVISIVRISWMLFFRN